MVMQSEARVVEMGHADSEPQIPNGFKLTEVGVIPGDWEVVRLRTACTLQNGRAYALHEWEKSGTPVIRLQNLTGGDEYYYSSLKLPDKQYCQRGDLLYMWSATFGPRIWIGDRAIYHYHIWKVDPDLERATKAYLFYKLSEITEQKKTRAANGGTMLHVTKSDMEATLIALPKRDEQQTISEALSDADALIESLEQLVAKKRQIKQGAMQELLTGKKRLPGFERIPGHRQTEVGIIPKDWEIKFLPDVCRFRGGKAHEQYISDFGHFICVNSKFISTDGRVRKHSIANFCPAKKDDILMVMSDLPNGKALAKAYLVDQDNLYTVNQRVCALTPYRDHSKFLLYILNRNPYFLKFDDGVNQTHLLNPVFQKCPLPLPPTTAEQEAIAAILSDIGADITALEEKLTKARMIKQGMMQELLTGRIRLI